MLASAKRPGPFSSGRPGCPPGRVLAFGVSSISSFFDAINAWIAAFVDRKMLHEKTQNLRSLVTPADWLDQGSRAISLGIGLAVAAIWAAVAAIGWPELVFWRIGG
jgi:hypothetical protein